MKIEENIEVVIAFRNWLLDRIMEGRIINPDEAAMDDFLEEYFPTQKKKSRELWFKYCSLN